MTAHAAYDSAPQPPFAGADICQEAGFTVRPGHRSPRFEEDVWDLRGIANLPVQAPPSEYHWDFTLIRNSLWRPVAKELMLAFLAPRHPAVVVLPHAYRAPLALRTCVRKLEMLTHWLNWLTAHHVNTLGQVDEGHCERFLAHRSHIYDPNGTAVRPASDSQRRHAACAVLDLASYAELFTTDRYRPGFHPWNGASSSAVVGMKGAGDNKTQPLADEILRPFLAASLFVVETLGPHLISLHRQVRSHRADRGSRPLRRPPAATMATVIEHHVSSGQPLVEVIDSQITQRLSDGWEPNDPLLKVSFIALANEAGYGDFRHRSVDNNRLRSLLEAAVNKVGTQKYWLRSATEISRADGPTALPWSLPLHTREAMDLVEVGRTACLAVIAAASGMRSSELMELRIGCRQPPQEVAPGLFRHRLFSRIVKGQPLGGIEDEWVVVEQVERAVALAEQLLDSTETGQLLFGRIGFTSRYEHSLRPWVNGPAGRRLGLDLIPEGQVNMRILRRTLAVEMAYRPGGLLAAKIALKHISVATTEGYAARPGGAQAKLVAEVNAHEQERNLSLLLAEFRNYQAGVMPAGPGARDLLDLFAHIDGRVTDGAPASPKTVAAEQEVRNLLAKRAQTLHLGTANYCWFSDPGRALCLKLAGTPQADKPLIGLCDSARCPQATHHPCHRPVWAEAARTKKVFIAGLGRTQRIERARLEDELERDERVLEEIDAATGRKQ
ncbi:site-specific integrase [Kitasatospora sp. NPDC048296]|uniref:site-specific integrase n=1 Tax=Kitasatospora sp. NPDC048296 TaxID=3364048 RepID=UPI00371C9274